MPFTRLCNHFLCPPQPSLATALLPHLTLPRPLRRPLTTTTTTMDCTLVLCGKSPAETAIALSLKSNRSLNLPETEPNHLSILLQSEIKTNDNDDHRELCKFEVDRFFNSVSTERFGRFLIWSPRLSSTHDLVSRNFYELPIGTVCVADVQHKGRGRSKNVWESPKGCLLFSFTIQMENGGVVPLLQYVVSLAVTEAIKDVCYKNGFPFLDVRIKWPNDLYLNGLKVGGILCTSTSQSGKFNVSVGVGLNVDNEKPTTCLNAAVRALSATSVGLLRREVILAAFFNKFENLVSIFNSKGFGPLEDMYYKTWLHSGQRVIIQEKNGDQVVEDVVTIQGLTGMGYLLAVGDDSNLYELHPDGNSFDFFKGLIRRKI